MDGLMSDNLYSWFPRALVMGAAVVGLSGLPARAQQITDPSPAQAATNVEPTSPISASFRSQDGVSVRPETVRVFVDGKDVTAESVITRDFFTYRPSQPLPPGRREVLLEFTNTQGVTRRVTWSFTVGNPVRASIDLVDHNAGNRPLAAGEILLVTVKGTPSSRVTVYLVQDGRQVQTLPAQEVSSGTYVVNALIEPKDATREGIVIARLENGGQVRFMTAEQPARLIEGAAGGIQRLATQEVAATISLSSLLPQITNLRDGDRVSGSSFTLQGTTAPNASVRVNVTASTSLGGIISAQQTVTNQTVQADAQGRFTVTVRPPIPASGTVYQINLTATSGNQTSPTVTLRLTQQ
ncbi:hypothetical protein SYN63AY4M2_09740 [Synechococcus sp. 63AY4M2]|nr:conserved domain protein [Synechococcus sp. JA-3-3Ab]PIK86688.1 hypothetical protein SYN63AY4M2_09740 [Synechococcus sp. 63AY4M2]PIK87614.1 hypothetical protein SYN65AY6A5_00070 [Synechococcus sp. 65AY6A5]PIK92043.1 hypothetical protein SYN65AY6LI_07205 [Synechococcus sp. 65AY6Li]PIK95757.1 hypothetical protein SYN60AY4M2_10375 [Synechococcus sp. 60AY4M2]PIK97997.1 hypothetical protein SYN63AY4M1_07775 [Synechococcus sp. 63AY4M1]PIL01279.1 hypothetical protein SYN65AY640_06295 [Synechococc